MPKTTTPTLAGAEIERAGPAFLTDRFHALMDAGLDAQRERTGRELAIFERDFGKIARLVDALAAGNYLDTAADLAGISRASVRSWMAHAEKGDPRYQHIAALLQLAASLAEADSVAHVRAAGQDPRLWAASMTFLERRYPGKWGRRSDESDVPRVIVQIGVQASDVRVISKRE
jgi:hypothetical protein